MSVLNGRFLIVWKCLGQEKSIVKDGLTELSEFVRNSDVYDREIVSITPVQS